ncbi:MAG: hypothetical protein AB2A00_15135, partial [Myxococcota bacterium]
PPTSPTSSPTAGADLRGLQSIPEICGLNRESDEVVEDTAEAMHIAVSECAAEVGAHPPLSPVRWLVFRVDVPEQAHVVRSPSESWRDQMDACLLRHPPRFPRAVRGKPFSAWYLMQANPQDRPPGPACVTPG